jgi:hypothetical protein
MKRYYFAATSLPPLHFDVPPEVSFESAVELLDGHLAASDSVQLRLLRRRYDIDNLQALWSGLPHNAYGNLTQSQLVGCLADGSELPDYVFEFTARHATAAARLRHFAELQSSYYSESACLDSYMHHYFSWERGFRQVLAALRAKHLGRDLTAELANEDQSDPLVSQLIAQQDAKTLVLPADYEPLKDIYQKYKDQPLEMHKALCLYQFQQIEELLGLDSLSLAYILGYLTQLIILEQWYALDSQRGIKYIDVIAKEAI